MSFWNLRVCFQKESKMLKPLNALQNRTSIFFPFFLLSCYFIQFPSLVEVMLLFHNRISCPLSSEPMDLFVVITLNTMKSSVKHDFEIPG